MLEQLLFLPVAIVLAIFFADLFGFRRTMQVLLVGVVIVTGFVLFAITFAGHLPS